MECGVVLVTLRWEGDEAGADFCHLGASNSINHTAFNAHLFNNVRMLSLASGGGNTGSANSPTTSSQAGQLLHSHNIAWCSQDKHSTR